MRALGGLIDNAPLSLADRHVEQILCQLNNNKRGLPYKTRFSRLLHNDCDDTEFLATKEELICVRGKPLHKNGDPQNAASLLNLYKRKGENLVQDLCGHFLIIILHRHSATLCVLNDKFSSYPLYYTRLDSLLIFCDRFKNMVQAKVSRLEANLLSVQDYLQFGKPIQGRTWFHNIQVLKPGESFCYQEGELRTFTYENYQFHETEFKDFNEAHMTFKHLLSNQLKNLSCPLAFMSDAEPDSATQFLYDFSRRIRDPNHLHLLTPKIEEGKSFFELIQYWLHSADHAFCAPNDFLKPLILQKGIDSGYMHFVSAIGGMPLLCLSKQQMPKPKPKRFSWIYGINQAKTAGNPTTALNHWLDADVIPHFELLAYENQIQDALIQDEKQFLTANALYESDVATLFTLTESAHVKLQMPYLQEMVLQFSKKMTEKLLYNESAQTHFFENALHDIRSEASALSQGQSALTELIASQPSIQEFFQDLLQTALGRDCLNPEKIKQLRMDFHHAPRQHLEAAWRLVTLELYLGELEALGRFKNSPQYA